MEGKETKLTTERKKDLHFAMRLPHNHFVKELLVRASSFIENLVISSQSSTKLELLLLSSAPSFAQNSEDYSASAIGSSKFLQVAGKGSFHILAKKVMSRVRLGIIDKGKFGCAEYPCFRGILASQISCLSSEIIVEVYK
jgi:hypothetical protein